MSSDSDISDRLTEAEERTRDRFFAPLVRCLPDWVQPNHITVVRIVLVVATVIMYGLGLPLDILLWILVVAALTDTLDGPLARIRQRKTRFGALFDQVCDWCLALWIGVLALSHRLIPGQLLVAMVVIHACMLVADRFRAALLAADSRKVRAVKIALGAANFAPNTVARMQFVTILLGFFFLLFGRNRQRGLLSYLGLGSLYVELVLTAILAADGFARYARERRCAGQRGQDSGQN